MILYIREEATGKKITSPKEVFETIKEIAQADQEGGWLLGFDSENKEFFRGCIFLGGLNYAGIDMKILFKRVLVSGSAAFIFIHNHPSGSLKPSSEDLHLTEKIKEGAKLLELSFLDHIIIGGKGFISMKEEGLL